MSGLGALHHAPRALAAHGGVFFVAWGVVLVLWALPLTMFEFGLGRAARSGPLGGFVWVFGRRAAWRGAFLAVVAAALLPETAARAVGGLVGGARLFGAAPASGARVDGLVWIVVGLALAGAAGVQRNEAWSRRVVPAIFVALVASAFWAWTLPGADAGLAVLVDVHWSRLGTSALWWDALVQASWSTGAGLGLMLLHARAAGRGLQARRESFATLFGVSVAGLLSALAVVPLLAATSTGDWRAALVADERDLVERLVPAFAAADLGRWAGAVFLAAVVIASLTSVLAIAMLLVRTARDRGVSPTRGWLLAAAVAGASTALWSWGDPPAGGERWVWRVGIVAASGLLTFSVVGHGANRFWIELIGGPEGRFQGGGGFRFVAGVVLPLLVLVLLVGHARAAFDAADGSWSAWLSPWRGASVGACLAQWGLATVALKLVLR